MSDYDPKWKSESVETAWRRNQKLVLKKIERLEILVEGDPPTNDLNFSRVGDLASIAVLLDKAIKHML